MTFELALLPRAQVVRVYPPGPGFPAKIAAEKNFPDSGIQTIDN